MFVLIPRVKHFYLQFIKKITWKKTLKNISFVMDNRIWKYSFLSDENDNILKIFTAGTVLSYLSMIFNLFSFLILCRKNLRSPATILMQGLALADFLTALSSHGLQPLFQNRYKCYHTDITDSYECSVAVYLSISSTLFHTSNLLTKFLGMQKVIAIRFPIWTRFHLTNRKAVICCFITFLLCVTFSVPRYFVIDFKYDPTIWCTILPNNI